MNNKVIAAITIALSLIVVGWVLFRSKDGVVSNDEINEGDSSLNPPNFNPDNSPERTANMTGGFKEGLRSLMELVNSSGSPLEIYDLIVNATDNMESMLNQTTTDLLKDRLAPMVETLKALMTEVGNMIAEGASDEDVRSLASRKLEELFGERLQPPQTE